MVRFLHTADWQLGMSRHFLAGDSAALFRQARIDVIKAMAALAAERDCAFAVVAGDVFESNQVSEDTVVRALDALGRFTIPVLLLPGNHDPLEPGSVYTSPRFLAERPDCVHVVEDQQPWRGIPGVEVIGAPWPSRRPTRDLAAQALETVPAADGTVRVLLAHGIVDTLAPDPHVPGLLKLAPIEEAIADRRLHYVALGDRHSFTVLGAERRVVYAGAPEPTSYRETDPGRAVIVEVDQARCELAAVRVGAWRFAELARTIDGADDIAALEAALSALGDLSRTAVKLKLSGTITLSEQAALEAALDGVALRAGALERPVRHEDLHVRPDNADFRDVALTGYAAVARDALLREAEGNDSEAAVDALALLLRLSEQGQAGER